MPSQLSSLLQQSHSAPVKYIKDVPHIVKPMLNLFKTKPKHSWINLESVQQLQEILDESKTNGTRVALFKHSTRCSISSMAKSRLESASQENWPPFYLLDLIQFREVSSAIAEKLTVVHESPQLLIVENGKCVFSSTHSAIHPKDLPKQ
ncbi:MAG: bacillithiol system protein YtxJ [Luteibaculaceae bacterium]